MKISVVDFVNAWPLSWGFRRGLVPGVDVIRDVPSACADRLHRGEVDAGLVPVVELARTPGLEVVRGLGICARREVRTVLLLSRVPVEKIRHVGIDGASRSSAALVRLLLEKRYGLDVDFHKGASDLSELLRHNDAGLLIGDPALALDAETRNGLLVLDLAAEWNAWTGLPFVFAVWAVRAGTDPAPFYEARLAGFRAIDEIVREGARESGKSESEIRLYLTEQLSYDLGAGEERGIEEFLGRCAEAGILSAPVPITWTGAARPPASFPFPVAGVSS